MTMAKTKKTAAAASEAAQSAPELQDAYQDLREPEAIPVGVEAPPVSAGEIIGPEDVEDLLGCQDGEEQEPYTPPVQYVVTADPGLNLREGPSKATPIIVELPHGVGVFPTGVVQGPWMEVATGRLTGWVLAEFLEPEPLFLLTDD